MKLSTSPLISKVLTFVRHHHRNMAINDPGRRSFNGYRAIAIICTCTLTFVMAGLVQQYLVPSTGDHYYGGDLLGVVYAARILTIASWCAPIILFMIASIAVVGALSVREIVDLFGAWTAGGTGFGLIVSILYVCTNGPHYLEPGHLEPQPLNLGAVLLTTTAACALIAVLFFPFDLMRRAMQTCEPWWVVPGALLAAFLLGLQSTSYQHVGPKALEQSILTGSRQVLESALQRLYPGDNLGHIKDVVSKIILDDAAGSFTSTQINFGLFSLAIVALFLGSLRRTPSSPSPRAIEEE